MRTVSVIGVGRLGGALAIALSNAGYSVRHLVNKRGDIEAIASKIEPRPLTLKPSEVEFFDSDIVFITTGDGEIERAADAIAEKLDHSAVVLHASGALSSELLRSVARRGNPTGSMHPLLSVSDPQKGSSSFRGTHFCVEGDRVARRAAEEVVEALGGHSFTVDTRFKPLYHAAAVMASGHVTALFSLASKVLALSGPSPDEAAKILRPLVESTVRNLSSQTPERALTGPFARADLRTVQMHLKAFDEAGENAALEAYIELGLRSADLAEKAGADPVEIGRLREYIKLAKASDR